MTRFVLFGFSGMLFALAGSLLLAAKAQPQSPATRQTTVSAPAAKSAGPSRPVVASARFQGRDATTRGNWVGRYGKHAFMVPIRLGRSTFQRPEVFVWRGTGELPPEPFNLQNHSWKHQHAMLALSNEESLDDPRLPVQGPGMKQRHPQQFLAEGLPLVFRVDVHDAKPRRLSLYFLDFKRKNLVSQVEIHNQEGRVLDQRKVGQYGGGVYVRYRFQGSIYVVIRALHGNDPTLSGLFIDPI